MNYKYIRYFVNITAVINCLGGLILLSNGELNIYGMWNVLSIVLAAFYINGARHKDDK